MSEVFGKYELLERVGVGGMAEVFRARRRSIAGFEKIIVVKRILKRFANDSAFIEMLIAEAKLSSLLSHPNIVPIFDLGEVDGTHYIVMEYVHGSDLLHVLKRTAINGDKFPMNLALHVASELANGLAYAHSALDTSGRPLNLIHRDVSPANVLISTTGAVRLTDFGVARADHEAGANVLETVGPKGKLSYMSPELVGGEELDHRSDIFALGTLLWEMLTLKRLFLGRTPEKTIENVRRVNVARKFERHDYIPDPVMRIIRKALERQPSDRYSSANQMAQDILDYLFEQRIRVGNDAMSSFVCDLFDELVTPVDTTPVTRLPAAASNVFDTVEDEGVPASLVAIEVATGPHLADASELLHDSGLDPLLWAIDKEVVAEARRDATASQPEVSTLLGADEGDLVLMGKAVVPSGDARDAPGQRRASIGGGDWVRIAHHDILSLGPALFPAQDAPSHVGVISQDWFPRLFCRLRAGAYTGLLRVSDQWFRKEIYLEDGRIRHIQSNLQHELLANLMVSVKLLSPRDVENGLAFSQEHGVHLGEALVRLEHISYQQLGELLSGQRRARFHDLFGWASGTFAFFPHVDAPDYSLPSAMDPLPELAAVVRHHYSLGKLRALFEGHTDAEVFFAAEPPLRLESLGCDAAELDVADGVANGLSLGQAVAGIDQPEDERRVWCVLFLMLQAGIVKLRPSDVVSREAG
jgi:serine/threonine protein kinase